jgi:hypothetical protein
VNSWLDPFSVPKTYNSSPSQVVVAIFVFAFLKGFLIKPRLASGD